MYFDHLTRIREGVGYQILNILSKFPLKFAHGPEKGCTLVVTEKQWQ